MPQTLTPSEVKALIPGPTGNFCSKFLQALGTPAAFYKFYSYTFLESGEFTPEFIADLCATQCFGGNGGPVVVPPGGLAAPTGLTATDGDYPDHINLAWVSVVTATGYDVYRSLTNDSSTAALLASLGQVTMYTDMTVDPGQTYWYWVKAKKVGVISAFSAPDSGFAAQATLTAPTDLKASRGFYSATVTGLTSGSGLVALVFTASAAPANAYDIYRNTTDDFATATRIDSNRIPFDTARKTTTCSPTPCTKPLFVNNGGHLVYHDKPPSIVQRYYYWVVAKQLDGSTVIGVSGASNSGYGWIVLDSTVSTQVLGYDVVAHASPVASSRTRAYVVMIGPYAGGAGGGDSYGGGGGGGGAIIAGYFAMVAGPNRRWKMVTGTALGGVAENHGADSVVAELQYDPGTGTFAAILSITAAGKGLWNAVGGGLGGAGSVGSVVGAVTASETEPGFAGEAAAGIYGGRGGAAFGVLRSNPHNFPNVWNVSTETARLTQGGGGSDALPGQGGLADGGVGSTGYAIIVYY